MLIRSCDQEEGQRCYPFCQLKEPRTRKRLRSRWERLDWWDIRTFVVLEKKSCGNLHLSKSVRYIWNEKWWCCQGRQNWSLSGSCIVLFIIMATLLAIKWESSSTHSLVCYGISWQYSIISSYQHHWWRYFECVLWFRVQVWSEISCLFPLWVWWI